MEKKMVRPAKGLSVRMEPPARGFLSEEGAEVEMTRYWRRRLADGDVVPTTRVRQKTGGK